MTILIATTLLIAILAGLPVGIALGLAALMGLLHRSPEFLVLLPQKYLNGVDSFPLLAVPMFILAGLIMSYGGIARRLVDLAMVLVGRIPGGLALVSILSTMLFSGISGSPSANAAAIGSVTLPAMKKRGYPAPFATAVQASAGCASMLVPPSVDFIIVGVIANISIGGLFAAGILPAVVNGLALMAVAFLYARRLDLPVEPAIGRAEAARVCRAGLLPLMLIVLVLGGIYGGIFTPTEASAIAVVFGFCVSYSVYRELTLAGLQRALLRTGQLTGAAFLVLAMASILSHVLTLERVPFALGALIEQYSGNWVIFVMLVNVVFLLLGMVMDALPVYIVLLPILVPVGVALGMEPLHLGTLIIANVGLGLITPPVGITLYVTAGVSEVPVEQVIKPLLPFLVVLAISLLIISYVPQISLFIPRLLGFVAG